MRGACELRSRLDHEVDVADLVVGGRRRVLALDLGAVGLLVRPAVPLPRNLRAKRGDSALPLSFSLSHTHTLAVLLMPPLTHMQGHGFLSCSLTGSLVLSHRLS
eukprot:450380-Pleurochrysis_carterae.AAC.2